MSATDPGAHPERRLGPFAALSGLFPYLGPACRRALTARVAVALVFLGLATLATVVVPLVLRQAVDALTPAGATETAAGLVLVLPLGLLLAYGVVRVVATGFGEVRDMLCFAVWQNAGVGRASVRGSACVYV